MKMNAFRLTLLAAACNIFSPISHAQNATWEPSWSFSGFGTLAYDQTNTDRVLFANSGQPGGVGKEGGFGPDSLLGGQLNLKANKVLSATVQAIAKRNGDGDFKSVLEWAFVKIQATPNLGFRLGRIGAPLFAVSDYRQVNYANLWVRAPLDVYGQVAFSHFDGADAIYQSNLGSTTLTTQLFTGQSDYHDNGTPVYVRKELGLNVTAEFDNGITLRAGYARSKLTVDNTKIIGLVALLRKFNFPVIANQMSAVDKNASFSGLGIAFDRDNYVGSFEYTRRRTSSWIPDTTGWAATAGYRIKKFTPFIGLSRLKVNDPNVVNTVPAVPAYASLRGGVMLAMAGQNVADKTSTAGLRWDVYKNLALKVQVDRITMPAGAIGNFTVPESLLIGFRSDPIYVYAISADFVF